MADAASWPPGDGEMAERVRTFDWAATPLGPTSEWPEYLRTVVELVLAAPQVSSVACGPERLLIYNQAAANLYGARHPAALGKPLSETFADSYPAVSSLYDRAFAEETVIVTAQPLDISGGEVFDATLTPVRDRHGRVAAVHMIGFEVGARIAAETESRRVEQRLQRVLETDAVAVLFFRADGVLIDANDVFLRMTGYTREDVEAGRLAWQQLTPPEYLAESQAQMEQFAQTGRVGPYQKQYFNKDGSKSWMQFAGRDLGDGTIVEFGVNIDDRKAAEQALRESEERLAFLLRLTDALRPLTDADDVEREATRLLGEHLQADRCFLSPVYDDGLGMCVREEYLRGNASSVLGDYTFAQFGDFVGPELHAGRILAVEDVSALTGLSAAERASYAATQIQAYLLIPLVRDGRLAAFLTINHRTPHTWSEADKAVARQTADRLWIARERARAEAALREGEMRFRLVADNISQLAWTCDNLGDVNWYNQRWLEYTGLSFDEMKSWGWDKVQHPDHVDRVVEGVKRSAATGEPWEDTFPLRRHDGKYRWFYSRAMPIRDERGTIVQWFGTNTDITDSRTVEQALRDKERHAKILLAELQHRVRNTLAVVRSIARRTADNSETAEEMLSHFQGRLDAFSRVQAALTRSPDAGVDLESLIADELVAHAERGGKHVHLDGPRVTLGPKTAERMSLAIHELTTNAVKHGALRTGGKVSLNWSVNGKAEAASLHLIWAESGVEIRGRPSREGFGTELLLRSLPYDLRAETKLEFEPTGLRFELRMPLDPVEPAIPPPV